MSSDAIEQKLLELITETLSVVSLYCAGHQCSKCPLNEGLTGCIGTSLTSIGLHLCKVSSAEAGEGRKAER